MKNLSCELLELGGFSVLGTVERDPLTNNHKFVRRGVRGHSYATDEKVGLTVVNDEARRPWLFDRRAMSEADDIRLLNLIKRYNLTKHTYVPHTLDRGDLFRNQLLKL